jgi:hypothetical protein
MEFRFAERVEEVLEETIPVLAKRLSAAAAK